MEISLVTTKGQVVIPVGIRRRQKITKGTRVCFIERGQDIVLRPVTDEYIDSIKGSLAGKGEFIKDLLHEKKRERDL